MTREELNKKFDEIRENPAAVSNSEFYLYAQKKYQQIQLELLFDIYEQLKGINESLKVMKNLSIKPFK